MTAGKLQGAAGRDVVEAREIESRNIETAVATQIQGGVARDREGASGGAQGCDLQPARVGGDQAAVGKTPVQARRRARTRLHEFARVVEGAADAEGLALGAAGAVARRREGAIREIVKHRRAIESENGAGLCRPAEPCERAGVIKRAA